jgi:hypothetical protein
MLEQLEKIIPCIIALKGLMPREANEDFPAWIQRGLLAGLVTKEEQDIITKIYVYQPLLLIQHLSLA